MLNRMQHRTTPNLPVQLLLFILFASILAGCSRGADSRAADSSPQAAPSQTASVDVENPTMPAGTTAPTGTPVPIATAPLPTILVPTLDYDNAVPPSDIWIRADDALAGIGFRYPANWHLWLDEDNHRIVILNAAPESMIAIKGYSPELMRIEIPQEVTEIAPHASLMAYLEANILAQLLPEELLLLEELPPTTQGYAAVRVVKQVGISEDEDIYLSDGSRMVRVHSFYVPGKREEKVYLDTLIQVADTVVIPGN